MKGRQPPALGEHWTLVQIREFSRLILAELAALNVTMQKAALTGRSDGRLI
jgi:hypothetical protein